MTISLTCDYHDLSHGQPMGYIEHNFYYLVTITLFISITCFCSTFSRSNHLLPRIISSLSFAKQEDFLGREIISKISSFCDILKYPFFLYLAWEKVRRQAAISGWLFLHIPAALCFLKDQQLWIFLYENATWI